MKRQIFWVMTGFVGGILAGLFLSVHLVDIGSERGSVKDDARRIPKASTKAFQERLKNPAKMRSPNDDEPGIEALRNRILVKKEYTEDEIGRMLESPSCDIRQVAVLAVMYDRIEDLYPKVFDMFMGYSTKGKKCSLSFNLLLSQCVSGMGQDAIPLIEGAYYNRTYENNAMLAWLLGHLITRYELTILKDERVVGILRAMLNDPNESWPVRLRAAGSLGRAGIKEGYALALKGLTGADSAYSKMMAGWALGFIGVEEGLNRAIPVLINGVKLNDGGAKVEAIHGLGNIGEKSRPEIKELVGKEVTPLLNHHNENVRLNAVVCLGKIVYRPTRERVEEMLLEEDSEEIRMRSAQYLTKLEDEKSVPALLKSAMEDLSPRVRQWALLALQKSNTDIRGDLRKILNHEEIALNKKIARQILKTQEKRF